MRKGFTLIELLISSALIFVLSAVLVLVFIVGLKAWTSGQDRVTLREEASLAMDRMTRDFSEASNITAATSAAITFSADVNNDGTKETVSFNVDANHNLIRTVSAVAVAFIPDVQQLTFSYTDLNNNSITPATQADRNSIRIVAVTLTLNKDNEIYTLNSSVYMRNQGS